MDNNIETLPKKEVRYHSAQYIVLGVSAIVYPVDHPQCSNTNPVQTSRVLRYHPKTGVFETANTMYIPENA